MRWFLASFFTSLLAVTLCLGAPTPTEDKTDFSGTWIYDSSRSENVPVTMSNTKVFTKTVSRQFNELIVTTDLIFGPYDREKLERGKTKYLPITVKTATYDLDGKETTAYDGVNDEIVLAAKWVGSDLELTHRIISSRAGTQVIRTVTELWELSDEGKTLTIKQKIEVGRHNQASTFVFHKGNPGPPPRPEVRKPRG